MSNRLFTVVILHYKQPEFFKTSVDSVLCQDYGNIELIFADDCSGNLTKDEVEAYIECRKGTNIKNVIYQFNDTNLGTIKNINKAIENATGRYILFFAADDKLYSQDVLTRFVDELEKLPEEVLLLCGQSIMMDYDLIKQTGKFVPKEIIENCNNMTSEEQHTALLYQSCYALGATIFKRECFDKFGKFDESLKVIEDWSFFLDYTKAGNKVWYSPVNGLMHRAGGISENGKNVSLSRIYMDDINDIYETRVLPYLKNEKDIDRRRRIILHYKDIANNKVKLLKTILMNPAVCICQVKRSLFRRKNNG